MSDAQRIKEIEARLARALPGPWKFVDGRGGEDCGAYVASDGRSVCEFGDSTDYYPSNGSPPDDDERAVIEHLHEDLGFLLELVVRLRKE